MNIWKVFLVCLSYKEIDIYLQCVRQSTQGCLPPVKMTVEYAQYVEAHLNEQRIVRPRNEGREKFLRRLSYSLLNVSF